jgi:hypothetical protein
MEYADDRMDRRVAFALVSMIAVGCNKGSAAKLEGRWRGVKATGVTSDQISAANLFASKMELEFHGEQVSVHTGDEKQSSHFKVARDDKGTVVIITDADGPGDPQTFTLADEKTLDWAITPDKTIQFGRE